MKYLGFSSPTKVENKIVMSRVAADIDMCIRMFSDSNGRLCPIINRPSLNNIRTNATNEARKTANENI